MPLVQDDPESDLNSFIDVAIKDDHIPILKASRSQNPFVRRLTRTTELSSSNAPSNVKSSGRSVCSAPALSYKRNRATKGASRKSVSPAAIAALAVDVRPFHTDELQSIDLEENDGDDDISVVLDGAVLFQAKNDFVINLGNNVGDRVEEQSSRQVGGAPTLTPLAPASTSTIAQVYLNVEREAERVTSLEQDMVKAKFELAEARGQVDWYKLQHRHLYVEFEDLQAFCNQLQSENAELRKGIVPSEKKRAAWFKPERILHLNQPKQCLDYEQQHGAAESHNEEGSQSFADETYRSSQQQQPSDGDWDDDTMTTNFGGASRLGDESLHGYGKQKGPLVAFMDRGRGQQYINSGQQKCSSPHTDDTPKAITVTNRDASTEERVQNMVKMLEDDCIGFGDSVNDTKSQTEHVEYHNQVEEMGDQNHDLKEDAVQVDKKVERKNGLFSRFNRRSSNNSPRMKLDIEDGEQSVGTASTTQTTKTVPATGWNLQQRRNSFIEKHRFEPSRRGSMTDNNLLNRGSQHSSTFPNAELTELDLHTSNHTNTEESNHSEVHVDQDTLGKLKDQPRNGSKPWWAKVPKKLPKLNKPFQNLQQNKERQVDNNTSEVVLPVEESEKQDAWEQGGQELLLFEQSRSSCSSDGDMPNDLSGPAVPSTLHGCPHNYFQGDSSSRLGSSSGSGFHVN